jgi:hypothetical protein
MNAGEMGAIGASIAAILTALVSLLVWWTGSRTQAKREDIARVAGVIQELRDHLEEAQVRQIGRLVERQNELIADNARLIEDNKYLRLQVEQQALKILVLHRVKLASRKPKKRVASA